jgi:hypothetical protein
MRFVCFIELLLYWFSNYYWVNFMIAININNVKLYNLEIDSCIIYLYYVQNNSKHYLKEFFQLYQTSSLNYCYSWLIFVIALALQLTDLVIETKIVSKIGCKRRVEWQSDKSSLGLYIVSKFNSHQFFVQLIKF